MGGGDKLFLEIAGRPVIAHTWARFETADCIEQVVLVVRPERQQAFADLARLYGFRKPYTLAPGGAMRQDSVWNGLAALSPAVEIVAVHDGARPCTPASLIRATVDAARAAGAAVAAQRVTDTLKESDGGTTILRTVDRSRLWAVQTPQTFRVELLRRALAVARERGLQLTDDTAACECLGHPVTLVESVAPNPKVTVPGDLGWVELLLRQAVPESSRGPALAIPPQAD